MKKAQTLKKRSEIRLRKLRPVWIGAAVAFVLFWLYCVLRPIAPLAQNPYMLTYIAGALLTLYFLQYLNLRYAMDSEKQHLYDKPVNLVILLLAAIVIGISGALLLAKIETVMGIGNVESSAFVTPALINTTGTRWISLMGALAFPPLPFLLLSLAVPYLRRTMKRNYDYYIIGIYCFISFIKLGCHSDGCCYFVHMDFVFLGRGRFPGQLLESTLLFIVLGLLVRYRLKAKKPMEGILFPVGMMLYFPCFFFLDFLRDYKPEDHLPGTPLSYWQLLSIIIFITGAVWLAVFLWLHKQKEKAHSPS